MLIEQDVFNGFASWLLFAESKKNGNERNYRVAFPDACTKEAVIARAQAFVSDRNHKLISVAPIGKSIWNVWD